MNQSTTVAQNNRRESGPSNPDLPHPTAVGRASLSDSRRECRRIARSNYENFLVASVFLPRRFRQPFFDLYAYCRTADDLADLSPSPQQALDRLNEYGESIDRIYSGRPVEGIFVALAQTIREYDLPREPFDHLLIAFRRDQTQTRYETFDDLLDYCRYSANPVGHMVLGLAGCNRPEDLALSDQICTGLQLANFWQDIARDRQIGRVYLPADAMAEHGVSDDMLDHSSTSSPLRKLVASECDRAEEFFRRGMPLAERVPRWLAKDIRLFAHGGLATIDAIRAIDFDVLHQRPTVSKSRQLRLMMLAVLGRLR